MAKRFRLEHVYDSLVLSDNGQPLIEVKGNEEEKQLLLDVLNELNDENKQLKQELRYIQSRLHNATFDVRERTLKEVSDAIEKMKRYE